MSVETLALVRALNGIKRQLGSLVEELMHDIESGRLVLVNEGEEFQQMNRELTKASKRLFEDFSKSSCYQTLDSAGELSGRNYDEQAKGFRTSFHSGGSALSMLAFENVTCGKLLWFGSTPINSLCRKG